MSKNIFIILCCLILIADYAIGYEIKTMNEKMGHHLEENPGRQKRDAKRNSAGRSPKGKDLKKRTRNSATVTRNNNGLAISICGALVPLFGHLF